MKQAKIIPNSFSSSETKAPSSQSRLNVYLHRCSVDLHIGYRPKERKKRQAVIVDIDVESDLLHRYKDLKEDNLETVIDYSRLFHFVTEDLVKLPHIAFLETLADHIIDFCFQDARVQKVTVRLEKPEIYKKLARAGIVLTRFKADGGQNV